MQIGSPVPTFRAPAFSPGHGLGYLDSRRLTGRALTLAFVPTLGLGQLLQLNAQAEELRLHSDRLLLVLPDGEFHNSCWLGALARMPLMLLADPCRRLARSFRLLPGHDSSRCHSFALDERARLRFHLVHDLDARGLSALLEMLAMRPTSAHV